MRSVESTADDSVAVEDSAESQPTDWSDAPEGAVSWSTTDPKRLRSLGGGGLLGIGAAALPAVLMRVPALIEWLSVDAVLSVGLILFVAAPFVLRAWRFAEAESDTDLRSLPNRLTWSRARPGWLGAGGIAGGMITWAFWGTSPLLGSSVNFLPIYLAVGCLSLLFQDNWQSTTTVDPDDGVIEKERPSRTKRRSLDNTVRIRRFDLLGRPLFVFSNRGKQWYKGPHLLSVPAAQAPKVDPRLRRMVAASDSPERIDRDERLIIGGVGASMLLMGPLLYFLTGEGALLAVTLGPSAIVAHFALMHAHRA